MNSPWGTFRDKKGVTIIIVTICMVIFIGIIALAVDVGYMMVSRTELQRIADGAALAGARWLGRVYECDGDFTNCTRHMSYPDQVAYAADQAAINATVAEVASLNRAGGILGITINPADIVIGNWDSHTKILTATLTSPHAVRVTARRDASANGPINTFFAKVLGINTVNVAATATASLTGQVLSPKGGLPLPVAINYGWVTQPHCKENLTFNPSSAGSCAGWDAYDGSTYKASASSLQTMINAITAGTYSSPETTAGLTQYVFTNGNLASLFNSYAIQNLFNAMKVKNDGVLDMDEDPATWTTSVAIYDDSKAGCSPNKSITIVGFATITITKVDGPPLSTIYATVDCDNVVTGRGGGGDSDNTNLGSIPNLVQ